MKLYYRIVRKLKNLWYWIPVIWKDENWDHVYLERILLHKIKRMRDFHQKYDNALSLENKLQDMDEVINILNKRIEDAYFQSYSHLIKNDDWDQMFEKVNEDWFQLRKGWKISDNMDEYEEAKNKAELERKKDFKKLFQLLKKYENWWY